MRRFFIAILCCLLLTTAVCATGTVTELNSTTNVSSDGSCDVTLTFTLLHEGGSLRFPLPSDAYDITVNGHGASTSQEHPYRWVDLSGAVPGSGTYTVTLHYSLPDRVTSGKKGLTLTVPLLSGFTYPIERLQFSISLPGTVTTTPTFSSTYYPESADSLIDYYISDFVIAGHIRQQIKDHETLSMSLSVSESLFPQTLRKRWSLSNEDLLMYTVVLLAVLYWIVFLRNLPPRRTRRAQPIDGLTAGELGCCLTGQGIDFTAMVLSWAQMGYLSIRVDRSRRVLLEKRMSMGNERSELEMRCFRTLFGGRRVVDGGSEYFARLSRKMARKTPGLRYYFRKGWGNPNIFRVLTALIGVLSGVSLASAFAADTTKRVLLSFLLGAAGGVAAWLIQEGGRCLHLRKRRSFVIAVACSAVWFVLSRTAGESFSALFLIVTQFAAGLGSAYGGRRTDEGKQKMADIFGLRRYLKTVDRAQLRVLLSRDPDYYFTLAPSALALGVDRSLARKLGGLELNGCLYLSDDRQQPKTAAQWNKLLRQVVRTLDDRQHKPFLR